MYGHIQALAEAEKKGIESAGGQAEIFQSVTPPLLPFISFD